MREIEKKFLVDDIDLVFKDPNAEFRRDFLIRQFYLGGTDDISIRFRIMTEPGIDDHDWSTIGFKSKNQLEETLDRYEKELPLNKDTIEEIVGNCYPNRSFLVKERYVFQYKQTDGETKIWEVDKFINVEKPFVIAEIELDDINEFFEIPDWCGIEVTSNPYYHNSYISNFLLTPEPEMA